MPSASWLNGWLAGDTWTSTEAAKGMGSFFDSTLGVDTASFDITSVPTWGTGIRVDLHIRGTNAAAQVNVLLRLNNDSAANYFYEMATMTGAVLASSFQSAQTSAQIGVVPAASAAANQGGATFIEIPNFRGTTFNKVYYGRSGDGSTGELVTASGQWANTAAITRLTILPSAGSWKAGSRCIAYVLGP